MAGCSETSLVKKLGIKEGFRMRTVNAPSNYFELLGGLPHNVNVLKKGSEIDFIHLFITSLPDLDLLKHLRNEIKKDGLIWVSWEKKKTKLPGAPNENLIREKALALGLVDVKVCAIDEVWSGLKLVWRKENR